MKKYVLLRLAAILCAGALMPALGRADEIPKAAWRRPLGAPLANPGVRKNKVDIDDGYWQGAPVGGFGAGTFSRTYRGDFARWHIKAAVHKYETVFANQFAMFQKSEGDPEGTARVLMNGHPSDGQLSSWQWDYPVGAGDYAALFPKSWYDYRWDKFPAHVTLEQFSPVLPDNYASPAIRSPYIDGTRKTLRIAQSQFPCCSRGPTWSGGFAPSRATSRARQVRAITIALSASTWHRAAR